MSNDEKILAAIGELAAEVKANGKRLDGVEGRLGAMQQDVSALKADVSTLKEDVSEIKTMQEGIWQDIALHDEKIADVKKDTEAIRAAVAVNTLDIEDLRLAR